MERTLDCQPEGILHMAALRATPPSSIAPWAEVVPDAPYPMTVDDLLAWPAEDGYRYEVVEGVLVRMAGTFPGAGRVTRRLLRVLDAYVEEHDLGTVTLPDEVYDVDRVRRPNTGLLPDLGFFSHERDALIDPRHAFPFTPDLAVEVAGVSQRQADMDAKARRYLAAGTALVWVIWPESKRIDVWHRDSRAPVATLAPGDTLDGLDVVPGFTHPVADLFA
jgi:Uma2 family endonuclease